MIGIVLLVILVIFLLGGFSDGAASRTGDAEISLASRAGGASAIMLGASASATAAAVRG